MPLATLTVNFIGSFLIGIFIRNVEPGATMYYFTVVGLCGGFTTFSTFSLDVVKLLREGNTTQAALYIMISLTICILAVLIGTKIKI